MNDGIIISLVGAFIGVIMLFVGLPHIGAGLLLSSAVFPFIWSKMQ